jgi:hypothetical protein
MTDRQIIAILIKTLRRHEGDWDGIDREAVTDAVAWLRRGDELERAGSLSLNVGGVCDNCGEPAIVHIEDRCPSDERCAREPEATALARWHGIVEPARAAYQAARLHAKAARRNYRSRGTGTQQQYDHAEQAADTAWGAYQAAIRRADREGTALLG